MTQERKDDDKLSVGERQSQVLFAFMALFSPTRVMKYFFKDSSVVITLHVIFLSFFSLKVKSLLRGGR